MEIVGLKRMAWAMTPDLGVINTYDIGLWVKWEQS